MNKPMQALLTATLLSGCTSDKPEWITPDAEQVIIESAQYFRNIGGGSHPSLTCPELQTELGEIGTRLQAVFDGNMPDTDCVEIDWEAKAGRGSVNRKTKIRDGEDELHLIRAYREDELRWESPLFDGDYSTACTQGKTSISLLWDTSIHMRCSDQNITWSQQ